MGHLEANQQPKMMTPFQGVPALSTVINLIIETLFFDSITTCILWNEAIPFQLQNKLRPYLLIRSETLEQSFLRDVYDFEAKKDFLDEIGVVHPDITDKLTVAIDHTHCESFVAVEDEVPNFIRAYLNASKYSLWRSIKVKFLFVLHSNGPAIRSPILQYFLTKFANIIIIEVSDTDPAAFDIKTNKFLGPKQEHQEELISLQSCNESIDCSFLTFTNRVFEKKVENVMGREIIIAPIIYPPFAIKRDDYKPNMVDLNPNNPRNATFLDGSEVSIIIHYAEYCNATLVADTSGGEDWGIMYPNITGEATFGLLAEDKVELVHGAIYYWDPIRFYYDISTFIGFSRVSALVPKPQVLVSWSLALKPFQFTLWMALSTCIALEIIALMSTRRFEMLFLNKDTTWSRSFTFGFETIMKILINQSSTERVRADSVKTVLFSSYVIDIIITSLYGGGLASILTLPTVEEAPDSVERLFKFGLTWYGQAIAWMNSIANVVDNRIIVGVRNLYKVITVEEMAIKAKTEYVGFIVEELQFGHFGNYEFLDNESMDRLKLMVDFIYSQYTIIFASRNWPLMEPFNNFILMWHSSGFGKIWEWKISAAYLNNNLQQRILNSQFGNLDLGPVKLAMNHCLGILVIWVLGLLLSTLVFFGELYHSRKQNSSQRNHDIKTDETEINMDSS